MLSFTVSWLQGQFVLFSTPTALFAWKNTRKSSGLNSLIVYILFWTQITNALLLLKKQITCDFGSQFMNLPAFLTLQIFSPWTGELTAWEEP